MTQKKDPLSKTITLSDPIKYGDMELDSFDIRRPNAGELRGIKIAQLAEMDSAELLKLLPRISSPVLTEGQVMMLSSNDTVKILHEVLPFFQPG